MIFPNQQINYSNCLWNQSRPKGRNVWECSVRPGCEVRSRPLWLLGCQGRLSSTTNIKLLNYYPQTPASSLLKYPDPPPSFGYLEARWSSEGTGNRSVDRKVSNLRRRRQALPCTRLWRARKHSLQVGWSSGILTWNLFKWHSTRIQNSSSFAYHWGQKGRTLYPQNEYLAVYNVWEIKNNDPKFTNLQKNEHIPHISYHHCCLLFIRRDLRLRLFRCLVRSVVVLSEVMHDPRHPILQYL